ncbi:MAG: hypothetical protein QOJ13_402 [Gaiellales bacterium]|jgi:hypothetical protein|nr:hypothetical protein [Gaiellales bacterium]
MKLRTIAAAWKGMARALAPAAAIATALLTAPAAEAGTSFIVQCDGAYKPIQFTSFKAGYHSANDDPIVFPGQPGASHLHEFFGNSTTDAFSTFESLQGKQHSCAAPDDYAGYWQPRIWKDDESYLPDYVRTYYGRGAAPARYQLVWPPSGFKLVGTNRSYSCGAATPGDAANARTAPYDCATPGQKWLGGDDSKDGLVSRVIFPQCWDGDGIEPSDFHYGSCATTLGEKWIPMLRMGVHTNILGASPANITFGSFPGEMDETHLHADFLDGWVRTTILDLVTRCLNTQPNKCLAFVGSKVGDGGTPPAPPSPPPPAAARAHP